MVPPFDIYRMDSNGDVLWRGTAATLEEAQARAREFSKTSPGDYLIVSLRTGNRVVVKSQELGETSTPEA